MHSLEVKMAEALQQQQAGQVEEARRRFLALIDEAPQLAEAYYFKGMLECSQSRYDEALTDIHQAIALNPKGAVFYSGLGNVLFQLERLLEAAQAFETGLQYDPDHHELLNNLGTTYLQLGRPKDALMQFIRAVEAAPEMAILHLQMAKALKGLEEYEEAILSCQQAIALNNQEAEAYFLMGYLYHKLEERRLKDPKTAYIGPSYTPNSIEAYVKGLQVNPDDAQAYYNLGNALQQMDQLEEAAFCYETATEIDPEFALAWNNRGYVCRAEGRYKEAMAFYDKALTLDPQLQEAHFNRAVVFFLQGQLEAAWPEYEWRQAHKVLTEGFSQPEWQGEPLAGKTLLVRCEQGYGDTLQFIRFLKPLKGADARIILECQAGLGALLSHCPGLDLDTDDIVERSSLENLQKRAFDYHIPLLSLPKRLNTTQETLLHETPYLAVSDTLYQAWEKRLETLLPPGESRNGKPKPLKIGIVWSGCSYNLQGRHRSASVDQFVLLAGLEGLQLYSLQVEADGRHLAADYQGFLQEAGIIPVAQHFTDFAQTAACVQALDLVISIDTAVAHLAGALGKPVWMLLPHVADWRWMDETARTRWYPTMDLFRQESDRQWGPVFERLQQALLLRQGCQEPLGPKV